MRFRAAATAATLALLAGTLAACRTDASSTSATGADAGARASAKAVAGDGAVGAAAKLPRLLMTDKGTGAPSVSPYLDGGNQRWVTDADGVWTQEKPSKRITELSRQIGLRSVRYPGGTVANMFNYTKMTGEKPTGCQTSGGFRLGTFAAIPKSDTQYTIPRHARFMKTLQGAPRTSLLIAMINAWPDRAVGFVSAMAKATGQKVWNVEIGNEPYLANQRYWRSNDYGKRLDQYILGGRMHQPGYPKDDNYKGNKLLYPLHTCDFTAANARKATGLKYQVRFGPISTREGERPVIHAGDRTFHWVAKLAGHKGRVFTTHGGQVWFPKGTKVSGKGLRIDYVSGPHHGFADFYAKLKKFDERRKDLHINVCSSWAKPSFVSRMKQLAKKDAKTGRYDCLAVHSYSSPNADHIAGAHKQLNKAAHDLAGDLRGLRTSMRAGHAKRFLMVTEYGVLNPDMKGLGKTFAYDLYLAQLTMGQIRNGVRVATLSNFGTLFSKVHGKYQLTDRALVHQLYHRMAGQRPTVVKTAGKDGVWILATKGTHGRNLMVVNARGSGALHRSLAVAGGNHNRCVVSRSLSGSLGENSVPTNADPKVPTTHTSRTTWKSGKSLRIAVPAHSIALFTVTPKGKTDCGK